MGFTDFFRRSTSLGASGFLKGRTDRHSHVLFGVDDGIRNLEASLDVLSYMEESGIVELWCTPHIMEDVPNTTDGLKKRFEELCSAYKGPIKLHLGAEYMIDLLFEERLASGDLLSGDDGMLLMETYATNTSTNLADIFHKVQKAGYIPLLAHPERYRYLDEDGYGRLFNTGVRFQLNLPSIVGYYGEGPKKKALMLLEKGWYCCCGTDCHRLAALKEQMDKSVLTDKVLEKLSVL